MQCNFLIFPAPLREAFDPIYNYIYLIPRKGQSIHLSYQQFIQKTVFNQSEDQLTAFLSHDPTQKTKFVQKIDQSHLKTSSGDIISKKQLLEYKRQLDNKMKKRNVVKINPEQYIPCSFHNNNSKQLIIYFHANGEDICSCDSFIKQVCQHSKLSVLSMEYRSYLCYGGEVSSENIMIDAVRVLQYLNSKGLSYSNIILFGRSIGAAIAFNISSKYRIHSLILLSPFLSLKSIAEHLYGDCGKIIIKETFDNKQISRYLDCPILIVHGLEDNLVPYQHSLALLSQCKSYCRLKLIPRMTHSKFNFVNDFIRHFIQFLRDIKREK